MAEKFFVLGSNSFSGASFVDYLLSQGAVVFAGSRSAEPIDAFLPYKWSDWDQRKSRFQFQQLDLNNDTGRIIGAITDFQPDYVVNFAAQSMVAESWQYPEHWYATNTMAIVRLGEGLRRLPFLKRYVHVSTPEVYGSCQGNVTEDAPFNPSTPYAASRAAGELHLRTLLKNYGFPVVFTRAANVYGPGQQLYRIIPRTILFLKVGRKLQLHGGGRSVRSFIHIRDVATGTYEVARRAPAGEAYHFSTDRYISIRDLVEMICQTMNVPFAEAVDIVGDRPGKDAAYLLDSTKARQTLGWQDSMKLEDGIAETMSWMNRFFEDLKQQPFDYIHKP